MREIEVQKITDTLAEMCIEANCKLNGDIMSALKTGRESEENPLAEDILGNIIKNAEIAADEDMPICQDTGMAVVFIKLGQDAHLIGGDLYEAVERGVRRGYEKGYLRKSVVKDPVRRGNTGDNTPAIIHMEIVSGDGVEITLAPKGFGSENMSAVKMLKPSDGLDGIVDFVVETVKTRAETHVLRLSSESV